MPIRLNHAPFGLTFVNARALPDGRLVWYIALNRGDSPLPLRAFVATFRTELGFRDGDWPELVGNRFFRRYANGAISLRHLGDLAWEVRYRFACWEADVGAERPFVLEDSAYAYVDERAGSLVFGRDETRGGAALLGPPAAPPAAPRGQPAKPNNAEGTSVDLRR